MPSSEPSTQSVREIHPSRASDGTEGLHTGGVEPMKFPEGGTAAWCAVIGGVLVMFCGFGYTTAFGVYQDFYTRRYLPNALASTISWIGGTNAFLAAFFGLVSGPLHDRGYFYYLLIGGSFLESFALFMLSLTQPHQYYQVFLAQGIALGIAQGLLFVPIVAVLSHYFHRRRTLAMTLVVCGSSMGSIVHPIMLNNLFNRSIGFANGVRISAALVSVLLFVACLLVRTRLEPPKSPANYLSVTKGIFHDVPFCIMCVGVFCASIGFYYPLFYLQLDSIQHGNPVSFSFYSLVLLNGGGFIGRLSSGFIASRIGVPMLITIAVVVCGILNLGMIGLSSVPSVAVIGIIYGYFSGIFIALVSPLVAHLTSDMSELGARMGIASAAAGLGAFVGGPIAGALLTSQYKWWRPSLFSGLVTLTGSLFLAIMMAQRKRSTDKEKESSGV